MNKIVVTTSWDDGHVLDLKLADLLRRYTIAGTFYIAPENHEIPPDERLSREQVLGLSKDFEIGGHTMTHPRLSDVPDTMARQEVTVGKRTLEGWIGHEVKSFCYPGGDYTAANKQMVKEAGFTVARTVERFAMERGADPLAMPTTIHAYRHWSDILPIFRNAGAGNFVHQYGNWDELAIDLFDKIVGVGGVFHLWGHSWEIEKNRDWNRLERVLNHIANRPEIAYVTNGQLA